jgi:hypothetical protein
MYKKQSAILAGAIEPIQKLKTLRIIRVIGPLKLLSRPENSTFRADVESFRIAKCPLVVIAEQADRGILHDKIQAFTWIRAIAHHITQTVNCVDSMRPDIRQNNLKRFKVTVDVADNCATQRRGSSSSAQHQPDKTSSYCSVTRC